MIRAALLALLLVAPEPADACTCRPRKPLREAFEASRTVAIVRVVGAPKVDKDTFQVIYDIEVTGMWKGNKLLRRQTKLVTGMGGGDCGRGEHMKGEWILLLHAGGPILSTSGCDPSEPATKVRLREMRSMFGPPSPILSR